eukprot:PhF_6_TR41942/c0_g1_i1/m.63472
MSGSRDAQMAIIELVSMTICMQEYVSMRQCASENKYDSVLALQQDGKCKPQWDTYSKCRDKNLQEVLQWCVGAPGCDTPREEYLECMNRNKIEGHFINSQEKAHGLCIESFQELVKCGSKSIISELKEMADKQEQGKK